jgi:hypothetical protein
VSDEAEQQEELTEPEDTATKLTPFKLINAGEDTLDGDDVVFADFRPKVVPSDTPDQIVQPAPKASSAPAPAPSSESTQTIAQRASEELAQELAEEEDGLPSPSESSLQTSSSATKNG